MNEIRVLMVEDSETDTELILRELRKSGLSPVHRRVETREQMREALRNGSWDVVLCDHNLPEFNSADACSVLKAVAPNVPFIVVSGAIGEEQAAALMKMGVNDYVMKGNLKRLAPAITREIQEAWVRADKLKAEKELHAKERELWQTEQELHMAQKMDSLKDEFIGMVSHEIKNPLTIIIGSLKVAESKEIEPNERFELINNAAESAGALAEMVDNLLELSRYQSKRLNLQTNPTRIEDVIYNVIARFKNRSPIHRIVKDVPSGLPLATFDKIRIDRILNNLIENAIKYSPNGGDIKVTVQLEKSQFVISVSDQGIGISTEDINKLFKPFERLSVQNKYDIAGVGLGLRVGQILAEAHGGKIWVDSEPGKGSTFSFSIPVK